MLRYAYAALVGLLGASIVHIVIVLLVPGFSDRDAWSRLAAVADINRVVRLNTADGKPSPIGPIDPLFSIAACRFDLSEGSMHVHAAGTVPFWSASVYDRDGQNIYSFSDRTATAGGLDFVVLTPAQMVEIRKDLPAEFERSVFVEVPVDTGIVVARIFVPDGSWTRLASGFVDGMTCDPI